MGVDYRIVLTYAFTNALFIACGAVTVAISVMWRVNSETSGPVEQSIIFPMTPSMAGIAAGSLTIIAGVTSLPGLAMPTSRGWLHINSWFAVLANIFLLCVALKIWMLTLNEFENLFTRYSATSDAVIEAYQEKFNCCGFFNSTAPPFVVSANACPSPGVAAARSGCSVFLQPYADLFLNRIFTTLFGFVGIGMCTILASAMLSKARSTEARYIRIAEKGGL